MRKKNFFSTILSLLILIALIACGYIFFKDMDGPSIAIAPDTGRVSPHTPLQITLADPSNIRSLSVGVRRNNVVTPIFQRHFEEYLPQRTVEVSLKNAGLREGAFELEIKATDASLAGFGQGNTRTEVLAMRLDTQPPRISVKTLPPSVRRGGAAAIRYTIDEEVTQSGVLVAGYFVPGFLQKDGSYICFFPFPYTMTAVEYKNAVELTATDMAGNVTRSRLGLLAYERNFKSDTISISDNFLASVNSKLGYLAPNAANQLEGYLYINNQVRAANVETLRALRKDTAAAMLWDGTFQRLPRSAARAGFGDHRYFTYQGKQVGESYHLGFDLASVRNAEVPAANNGRVVFTGELGIYGNLIVIDHGLGLMSLYSHLSEIHVKVGDVVQKGAIIAKTGSTGLAFGDHLHFGMLVGGVEVTPLEWIDPKWIKDNITGRLNAHKGWLFLCPLGHCPGFGTSENPLSYEIFYAIRIAAFSHLSTGVSMERTFCIIKPDAVARNLQGEILAMIQAAGLRVVAMKQIRMTRQQAEGFYAVHKERPFFASLTEYMSSGPVVCAILEGDKAISRYRELMGATNPANAAEGTIRKKYAESIEANSVHGSDAPETAAYEMAYFFNALEITG